MNSHIFLLLVGILSIATNARAQEVDSLLTDPTLIGSEIDCILDRGACDLIGQRILRVLPEALGNNCARCTAFQARNARRLMNFMRDSYPAEWAQIVERYSR